MKTMFSRVGAFLRRRGTVQAIAAFLTNPHIPNFLEGTIYTGTAKSVCVPGLNCYSCPAATGACPVGAFQAVVGSSKFSFSYYITGILILIGTLLGRFVCGFLCPFGWVQDLLNKIPFPKKLSTRRLKGLRYLKYGILVVMVWALPALIQNSVGMGDPYFCKYVCPQGILEGAIPLSLADASIRAALGSLFTMKFSILATIALLSIMFYRPFCKWICPLGAFYSLFNKVSLLQYHVDADKCVKCGKCARVCKMDVDITKNSSSLECIRCGECAKACPVKAIEVDLTLVKAKLARLDASAGKHA
ncbi:MAG: 4Fe-4S binding protein [Olsenella uli]|uniref:4Fe-4S binding protein n=1 Tax=Olsenella uli TaxID=133926 RepID=UPI001DF8DA00|nr:4Fe-4S binding protein [Olsenella uli]MBS6417952.1 4Fe-4S binding protein [Olsenella uli]